MKSTLLERMCLAILADIDNPEKVRVLVSHIRASHRKGIVEDFTNKSILPPVTDAQLFNKNARLYFSHGNDVAFGISAELLLPANKSSWGGRLLRTLELFDDVSALRRLERFDDVAALREIDYAYDKIVGSLVVLYLYQNWPAYIDGTLLGKLRAQNVLDRIRSKSEEVKRCQDYAREQEYAYLKAKRALECAIEERDQLDAHYENECLHESGDDDSVPTNVT